MQLTSTPNLRDGLLRSFELGMNTSPITESVTRFSTKSIHNSCRAQKSASDGSDPAQLSLRPLFGKTSIQTPSIGDHPDFLHLKGTDETCYCPITTMFMDIESSTRLSMLFPLEDVRRIKNAFIRSAIQVVRSFDGHVHRIMGDAVMAYFGGTMTKAEDATIDGINCAAVLGFFAESIVVPKLNELGFGQDFGIRIGLDHGPEKDVLWSSYGFPGIDEVTATSFYVDVASKLQHAAGRNQIMVGGMLLGTLDFPQNLISVKSVVKDGKLIELPFIEPNYTHRDGLPVNYDQRILASHEYLSCTPLGQTQFPSLRKGTHKLRMEVTIFDSNRINSEGEYFAASRIIPKGKELRFQIRLPYQPMLPYKVRFSVINHGSEAEKADPVNLANHVKEYNIKTQSQHESIVHWETTKYRGLHFMDVSVETHMGREFHTRFGVYVE